MSPTKEIATHHAAQAGLSVVDAESMAPLTSSVQVQVESLSKKGACLRLDSPFVDGIHILMDVHNITPKLLRLSFPDSDGTGPEDEVVLTGSIVGYDYKPENEGPSFTVELSWVDGEDPSGARSRALKRLIRALKG